MIKNNLHSKIQLRHDYIFYNRYLHALKSILFVFFVKRKNSNCDVAH